MIRNSFHQSHTCFNNSSQTNILEEFYHTSCNKTCASEIKTIWQNINVYIIIIIIIKNTFKLNRKLYTIRVKHLNICYLLLIYNKQWWSFSFCWMVYNFEKC